MNVGIVCGYDLNADLAGYVSSIAPLIKAERLDLLIVSGGRTSRDHHSSEAWVISQGLANILPPDRVLLEEDAMTTLENLVFARGLAEEYGELVERFTVFCDRVHHRKVRTLARLILGAKTMVHSVERAVPLKIRLFEPVSHLLETVAALVPSLRKYLRAGAIRIKGITGAPRRERP
jgi:uncharacterized SAM-binding protein YcdF (DUF218 family)